MNINVFENIPFENDQMGKRFIVDNDRLKLIQVALRPGQNVPQHHTLGDLQILVLDGEVVIDIDGREHRARTGDINGIACNTPMNVQNRSDRDATFLIIRVPPLHSV